MQNPLKQSSYFNNIYFYFVHMDRKSNLNSRLNWLQEEQEMLKHFHEAEKVKSWKKIQTLMNQLFPDRKKSSKQYRERYTNYIRFEAQKVQRASWSAQEDETIFTKYMEVGSKWVQISKFINTRSENQIKNRFYSTMRKLVRRINFILNKNKHLHKIRKMIKQVSIFKVLESEIQNQAHQQYLNNQILLRQSFIFKLKNDCLRLAHKKNEEIDEQELLYLGYELHKFNSITRFENLRKSRKPQIGKRKSLPPLIGNKRVKQEQSNQAKKQQVKDYSIDRASKQTLEQNQKEQKFRPIQNQRFRDILFIQKQSDKINDHQKDLQYQLSLILGIEYQRQDFCFF